jgi:hypothetical protein
MSKIINIGDKKKKAARERLEKTENMLNKLLISGVITKDEENQIRKMKENKEIILNCPDKSIIKEYVVACDLSMGKISTPEYRHITALGEFEHDIKEFQDLLVLEKMALWELHINLNGKQCSVKDLQGNVKNGKIELLFSEDGGNIQYGVRVLLNSEILIDTTFNEVFYITPDYKTYKVEILGKGNSLQIETEGITEKDCAIHMECLLKRIKILKEFGTPEVNAELERLSMAVLSDIIETETGVKPEIEKSGEFIKVTTEEPTIN